MQDERSTKNFIPPSVVLPWRQNSLTRSPIIISSIKITWVIVFISDNFKFIIFPVPDVESTEFENDFLFLHQII